MAAVRVSPCMPLSTAAADSSGRPGTSGKASSAPPQPSDPASSPALMACRPGSISGADDSEPCSLPYATRDPL